MRNLIAIAVTFFSMMGVANAAEITQTKNIVTVEGQLEDRDSWLFISKFNDALKSDANVVYIDLNFPGGSGKAMKTIYEFLRTKSDEGVAVVTEVRAGNDCYSACAVIWLAGDLKYMTKDSVIGFHVSTPYNNKWYEDVQSLHGYLGLADAIRATMVEDLKYLSSLNVPDGIAFAQNILLEGWGTKVFYYINSNEDAQIVGATVY